MVSFRLDRPMLRLSSRIDDDQSLIHHHHHLLQEVGTPGANQFPFRQVVAEAVAGLVDVSAFPSPPFHTEKEE